MDVKIKNIFITGLPGVGKTTLIKEIVRIFPDKFGGFYTEEIRDSNDQRVGFKIITFSNKEGILAHVDFKSKFKVSKYGVDVKTFEDVGVDAMVDALNSKEVIVIDEIGKMECFSALFKNVLIKCLESDKKVLATIKYHPDEFIDKVKKVPNSKIFTLNRGNFERIKSEVIKWLKE